jgi:flagellar biosynthesis/type III secretory pathway protein FliH
MTVITTPERVAMEKGLAAGLEKGVAEGLEKGLEKGIELALELRFAAAGLALMPDIRKIHDADLLEQILASIKHADTP